MTSMHVRTAWVQWGGNSLYFPYKLHFCVQKVKKFILTGFMCIETGMVCADLFGANSYLVCEVQLISKTGFTHRTGKVLCDDKTLKYVTSNQRILISTHKACKTYLQDLRNQSLP